MTDIDITPAGEISDVAEVAEVEDTKPAYVLDSDRAFFRADYIRFAGMLQRTRHTRYSAETPKPAGAQDTVDSAAAALADILQADSDANPIPGVAGFDRDAFLAGTLL